jgi:hypothetical protein
VACAGRRPLASANRAWAFSERHARVEPRKQGLENPGPGRPEDLQRGEDLLESLGFAESCDLEFEDVVTAQKILGPGLLRAILNSAFTSPPMS